MQDLMDIIDNGFDASGRMDSAAEIRELSDAVHKRSACWTLARQGLPSKSMVSGTCTSGSKRPCC